MLDRRAIVETGYCERATSSSWKPRRLSASTKPSCQSGQSSTRGPRPSPHHGVLPRLCSMKDARAVAERRPTRQLAANNPSGPRRHPQHRRRTTHGKCPNAISAMPPCSIASDHACPRGYECASSDPECSADFDTYFIEYTRASISKRGSWVSSFWIEFIHSSSWPCRPPAATSPAMTKFDYAIQSKPNRATPSCCRILLSTGRGVQRLRRRST